MCGRFTLRAAPARLFAQFGLELTPRYNIAPTQEVLVVRGVEREVIAMRWGIPAGPAGQPMINARAETAASKPTFRAAFRERRCLAPADGFYEWKHEAGRRQPYYVQLQTGEPFAMAGLWEGEPGRETFAILTTAANELLSSLHDRMPVILDASDFDRWLDPRSSLEEIQALLRPYRSEPMKFSAVKSRINSAAHDDPRCLEPHRPDPMLF